MTHKLSRRDFLRLSSLAILGGSFRPAPVNAARRPLFLGRVIFIYATIYSRPSVFAPTGIIHPLESIVPIYAEVEGDDASAPHRRWYETDEGFVYSTNVQPVLNRPNQPEVVLSPRLGEVTVPFVDALASPLTGAVRYRLYFSATFWVNSVVLDEAGDPWYELNDDRAPQTYFVPAQSIRLVPPEELTPLSPGVADKRIQIDTTAETITAFEHNRPVFTTRISSGGNFGEGNDFRTPLGDYRIDRKRASRHMAAGDLAADDAYDLPGVPWVCYFNGGIALHGTYWHNDFGRPWSHGCINLLSQDAKWFFRWTTPVVQASEDVKEAAGTPVTVV